LVRDQTEIVEKYGAAYTGAFAGHPSLKKLYVDAFSGAGVHVSKAAALRLMPASSSLEDITPFDGFFFIDMNEQKTAHLKSLAPIVRRHIENWRRVSIPHTEATSDDQIRELHRALCLFDL